MKAESGSATVAVLRTRPGTVISDYHELMNLAGYREALDPAAETALKINISWHFFFPAASTTPWQLDGVIRALETDGYDLARVHACHNRTVVIDAHLGERENKHLAVVAGPRSARTSTCTRARNGSISAKPWATSPTRSSA